MPAPLLAGDVIPASAEASFTPVLSASTTAPTLGTGSTQTGRYYIDPITGWVHGQLVIRFGTSGTNAGSGSYLAELPTAIDNMSSATGVGLGDVIGWGAVRDNSASTTGSRLIIAVFRTASGGTGGVGQAALVVCNGTSDFVTDAAPFAWTTQDGIQLSFAYPGA